jgi:hypothetical protein
VSNVVCGRCNGLFVERDPAHLRRSFSLRNFFRRYDHFGACRGLTSEERAEFDSLREGATSRRGSSSDASSGEGSADAATPLRRPAALLSSSATSRFYAQSAVRLGLVDTENGIRFRKSPVGLTAAGPGALALAEAPSPEPPATARREPVGMTALMLAATDPELRKAFEKSKAV